MMGAAAGVRLTQTRSCEAEPARPARRNPRPSTPPPAAGRGNEQATRDNQRPRPRLGHGERQAGGADQAGDVGGV